MEYRQLGTSGLQVSVLALGTGSFTGGQETPLGSHDVSQAQEMVDLALESGINLFDSANVYSAGVAEEILGQTLKNHRDDVVISTKFGGLNGPHLDDRGSSRSAVIRAAEASLRRLATDWIDLYQMHMWDGLTPVEETLEALDHLMTSGKVRYIGVSNFSGWHVSKFLRVAAENHLPRVISQQINYTPQARDAENELLPIAVDNGLGTLIWGPLAGGLLTGKYRRDVPPPPGARHTTDWDEPPIEDIELVYRIVDALIAVADEHADQGATPAQVCLAWELTRPAVSSVIIGARKPSQLVDNLATTSLTLTDGQIDRIDVVSRRPLLYPYWHQARAIANRLSSADLVLLRNRTRA